MKVLFKGTRTTPMVIFDEGNIQIKGRSIPVVDADFYYSLVNNAKIYAANPAMLTTVDIDFECINAYSKKSMMQFLRILENIFKNKKRIIINWYYRNDDDSMLELGKIYQTLVSVPFSFIEKSPF